MSLMKRSVENSITGLDFLDGKEGFPISAHSFNVLLHHKYPFDEAGPCDNAVNNSDICALLLAHGR